MIGVRKIDCSCGGQMSRVIRKWTPDSDTYACPRCRTSITTWHRDPELCTFRVTRSRECGEKADITQPMPLCIEHHQALTFAFITPNALERYATEQQRERAHRLHELEQRDAEDGIGTNVVYYIRRDTRIKIGTTCNLTQRMLDLQPDEILAVEPGSYELEHRRHEQFAHLRVRGEWFTPALDLLDHIAAVKERRNDALAADAPMTIGEASIWTGVPAGTIRRWLSEDRLVRRSDTKPYLVSAVEVLELSDLMSKTRVNLRRVPEGPG